MSYFTNVNKHNGKDLVDASGVVYMDPFVGYSEPSSIILLIDIYVLSIWLYFMST